MLVYGGVLLCARARGWGKEEGGNGCTTSDKPFLVLLD